MGIRANKVKKRGVKEIECLKKKSDLLIRSTIRKKVTVIKKEKRQFNLEL